MAYVQVEADDVGIALLDFTHMLIYTSGLRHVSRRAQRAFSSNVRLCYEILYHSQLI